MPSARSTLAIVAAALVCGTSVLAVPTENSYDLAERDYSDVAELDARMFDMDLEEYYVREGEATPAVATAPTTPVHHNHKHKGHHHKPGYKSLHSHSHVTPPSSPYTATSKLSTREPKRGKGRGGKGRKGRGRKGKGHKGKGGAPPAEAAAAPADAYAEPPATRDLEADDEMLSAREPRGGKGRGGKGRKHRGGHKGHKGKGRKGGAPPADAAAAPADAPPAEAPAARDIADADEVISAREPKGGKRHGRKGKGKGKGKGRKGKGRKGGKGKKAAAAEAAPAEAAPADASAAEPPAARELFTRTATEEKATDEKTPSPTVDATSPAPVHEKSHKAYKKSHKAHKKSHKKSHRMKKVNKAHRLYRHRLDGAKKHEGAPATTPTPSAAV